MGANVKYVGERVGRYDRYERGARKNTNRWMIPQPVQRRTNRWYAEPVHENAYWPCVLAFTAIMIAVFLWVWWIAG